MGRARRRVLPAATREFEHVYLPCLCVNLVHPRYHLLIVGGVFSWFRSFFYCFPLVSLPVLFQIFQLCLYSALNLGTGSHPSGKRYSSTLPDHLSSGSHCFLCQKISSIKTAWAVFPCKDLEESAILQIVTEKPPVILDASVSRLVFLSIKDRSN